jgi:hypothetical protein
MVYFNPECDTLYIGPGNGWGEARDWILKLKEIECLTNLRLLACDFMELWRESNDDIREDSKNILSLTKLESFSTVGGDWGVDPMGLLKNREITLNQEPYTLGSRGAEYAGYVAEKFKKLMGHEFKQRNVKLQSQHIWRNSQITPV